jgi:hypothetical protein
MIKKIGALLSAVVLFGTILVLVGCAAPSPRGSESPELGELRGGGGKPMSDRYNPWPHPPVLP